MGTFILILSCSQFHFSKNGQRHNSLISLCCSHKSIQAGIKSPPKEKAITECESDQRAGGGKEWNRWTQVGVRCLNILHIKYVKYNLEKNKASTGTRSHYKWL